MTIRNLTTNIIFLIEILLTYDSRALRFFARSFSLFFAFPVSRICSEVKGAATDNELL